MARAIGLAKKGLYSTMPNPRVGCILVQGDDVVGEGWHVRAGEGHAEVNALADAGDKAKGATAYVSLEPCSHTGKTGPCCEALAAAGVSRVVFGMEDPNPQVAGRGVQYLRDQGVEVDGPVLEMDAYYLNPGFIKRMESGVPLVRCKLAMSVDGRTAMASGESKWVTGPRARADVQALRARSCAVITGIGSINHDDSSLTVRENELLLENAVLAAEKQPLRVVLDSNQQLKPTAKVLQSPAPVLVVSVQAEPNPELLGADGQMVEQICLPGRDGRIDLRALVRELGQRQCNEVLVEAGSTLSGAFLRQGLLDELVVYMAPKLLGSSARPLFDLPMDSMGEQMPLEIKDVRQVGGDWRFTLIPDPEG
ncbi:bifunctional diaminohydroxyphosphoribosylaminopyrimidine deaminase/5-amino-6-(5-phosphoribosylamino)uracil reductase RibD [Maricurvus nonylphenolicus]